MTHLTVSGKTIDEAIEKAVTELKTTKERLSYTVVQQPKKGFLGIIGSQSAMIEARILPDPVELARTFLEETVSLMGLDPTIIETKNEECVQFEFKSDQQLGRLIGKRGQTLKSLEHVSNLVANRRSKSSYIRIELDAENYRERRKKMLEQLAYRVASKVLRTKASVALEPMDAHERKIIHTTIQEMEGVATVSEGNGAKRHVVVTSQT